MIERRFMSNSKPTYQDLLEKIDHLQSENKQLRLRPAVHSTDARLMDFMKIKSQMANAMLHAEDLKHALRISIQYLSKIDNIHGLGFFKLNKEEDTFEVLQEDKLPKKFVNHFKKQSLLNEFSLQLFPEKSQFYSNSETKTYQSFQLIDFFQNYASVLILPIIEDDSNRYSLLLISKKAFKNNKFFKIIYENIQTQLKSSYSRIIKFEKTDLADDQELSKKEDNYANINKELLRQIKVYRELNIKNQEELDLYKSIINQQKDIIIRINREGQILYQNPSFKQIDLMQEGEDKQLLNYLGEGDFPGLDQILHDFEEGIQQVNCEIQLFHEYAKWFNFFFSPIKNKRGHIVEIQIVARNIDKIIRLEQKLELQKEMLINMLNESDFMGFAIDDNGFISMVTDNLEKETGLKENLFIHQDLKDLVDQNSSKEITNFLNSESQTKLKTQISFSDVKLVMKQFHLELSHLNCMSVKKKYFIGKLYPCNKKPANYN